MPKTILIVEDEKVLNDALRDYFNEQKYHVKQAFDGKAGLSVLEDGDIDIILLDLMMPEMDGQAFIAAIHEEGAYADIPIVVLTNFDGSQEVHRTLRIPDDRYLVKANTPLKEIGEKVVSILEEK